MDKVLTLHTDHLLGCLATSLRIFSCSGSKVYTFLIAPVRVLSPQSSMPHCPCSRASVLALSESQAAARRPWRWPSCATLVLMAVSWEGAFFSKIVTCSISVLGCYARYMGRRSPWFIRSQRQHSTLA